MSKAAKADEQMFVNLDYAVPQANLPGEGVWICANGYSIKITAHRDGGVNIRVWPKGEEDGDRIEEIALDAVDAK